MQNSVVFYCYLLKNIHSSSPVKTKQVENEHASLLLLEWDQVQQQFWNWT